MTKPRSAKTNHASSLFIPPTLRTDLRKHNPRSQVQSPARRSSYRAGRSIYDESEELSTISESSSTPKLDGPTESGFHEGDKASGTPPEPRQKPSATQSNGPCSGVTNVTLLGEERRQTDTSMKGKLSSTRPKISPPSGQHLVVPSAEPKASIGTKVTVYRIKGPTKQGLPSGVVPSCDPGIRTPIPETAPQLETSQLGPTRSTKVSHSYKGEKSYSKMTVAAPTGRAAGSGRNKKASAGSRRE